MRQLFKRNVKIDDDQITLLDVKGGIIDVILTRFASTLKLEVPGSCRIGTPMLEIDILFPSSVYTTSILHPPMPHIPHTLYPVLHHPSMLSHSTCYFTSDSQHPQRSPHQPPLFPVDSS